MRCKFPTLKTKCKLHRKNYTFTTSGDSCRELFSADIKYWVYTKYSNPKLSPYTKYMGNKYYGNTTLSMDIWGMYDMNEYNANPEFDNILMKLLDYILGISGVCLCNDVEGEKQRRNDGYGKPNNLLVNHNFGNVYHRVIFEYGVLSNFWLVSPITTSLISSMFRDCLSAILDDKVSLILDELVFSKVDYEEVKRVINEVDKERALDIYRNVIVPFYEHEYISNSNSIPMSRKNTRKAVDVMFREGTSGVFNPEKINGYWYTLSTHYGISTFTSYMCRKNSRGAERYLEV